MSRVFNNEAPQYISNLYTCPPSHYSNSMNYYFKDGHIQNKYSLLWCLFMKQVTSDNQLLSLTPLI